MTFYDLHGNPLAYCDDGEYIYLFSVNPVAYVNVKNFLNEYMIRKKISGNKTY